MKIDFNYDSINVQADLIDNICVKTIDEVTKEEYIKCTYLTGLL